MRAMLLTCAKTVRRLVSGTVLRLMLIAGVLASVALVTPGAATARLRGRRCDGADRGRRQDAGRDLAGLADVPARRVAQLRHDRLEPEHRHREPADAEVDHPDRQHDRSVGLRRGHDRLRRLLERQ